MHTAFEHFSRCVALSREHGFGRIEVANRSMAGFSRIYLNEARPAHEDVSAAARAAALVGQPRAQMLCETLGAFASYELGDMRATLAHLERETVIIRQLGARRFEAQIWKCGHACCFASDHRCEATALLREALAPLPRGGHAVQRTQGGGRTEPCRRG